MESAQPQVLPPQPVQLDMKVHNKDKNNSLLLTSIYLNNPRDLFFSMWRLVVFTITVFSTTILFEMIADVYTNLQGVLLVMVFWFVVILTFYSRETRENYRVYVIQVLM